MVLVAGANGNVGREVVRQLEEQGVACRALVRDANRHGEMESALCEVVEGDFFDLASLQNALDGCERAFLLSPLDARMTEMQSNFIECCQHVGVRHVVKLSSMGASVRSPVLLGKWHGEAEVQLENSGMNWTQIRPAYFMQNTRAWIVEIKTRNTFSWPLSDAKVSWIDARDIASCAVRVLGDDTFFGKRLNVTGGDALGSEEIAQILSRVLEREITSRKISLDEYRQSLVDAGLSPETADALRQLHGVLGQGHGAAVTKDIETTTGKTPRTFESFVRDNTKLFV